MNWWKRFLAAVRNWRSPPQAQAVPDKTIDCPLPTDSNEWDAWNQLGNALQKASTGSSANEAQPAPEARLLAADITPPPVAATHNRHARRVYERNRRKHDKFVEPQGPTPVKYTRAASAAKPDKPKAQPAETDIDDLPNNYGKLIVDEWIEGDGERVLYEESEFLGEFNFRDTILDQLERYWVYLDRMRKHDKPAYDLYRQVGATLVPYSASDTHSDKPAKMEKVKDIEAYRRAIVLSPWFRHNWPSFGCLAFGTNPRDEKRELTKLNEGYQAVPKFLYFRLVDKFPWTVQPVHGGKCYTLTIWWDRAGLIPGRHNYKWGRPQEFAIHIDDNDKVTVLKTRTNERGNVRKWWDWRIPYESSEWAEQYGITAQDHIASLFCRITHDVEDAAMSMLRIEVNKGDMTAVFGLPPHRTPYFFQDRDITLTEGGRRQRIFHMVRPHVRRDGTKVPTHFRGLREFTWAGYQVLITVPGRDHTPLLDYNLASHYLNGRKKTKDELGEDEVGRILRQQIHRP